jgi:lipoyl-dependent peroxiredoxin
MPTRQAEAVWEGSLKDGSGNVTVQSGVIDVSYSFHTRFEDAPGTNPEELIGAAHAGCFSMALAAGLGRAGFNPEKIHTVAKVHLEKQEAGFAITRINLVTEASVPNIDAATFQEHAQNAKKGCPVSKALAAIEINLDAKLV